jgi:hypothetical protein
MVRETSSCSSIFSINTIFEFERTLARAGRPCYVGAILLEQRGFCRSAFDLYVVNSAA